MANCGRAVVTKHHRSFKWCHRWPLRPPRCTWGPISWPRCHLANMIEDIDKIFFAYDSPYRTMSPFAKFAKAGNLSTPIKPSGSPIFIVTWFIVSNYYLKYMYIDISICFLFSH